MHRWFDNPRSAWVRRLGMSLGLLAAGLSSNVWASGALSEQVINPTGGQLADVSDGLKWHIGSNGQFQVILGGTGQTYGQTSYPKSGSMYNGLALRIEDATGAQKAIYAAGDNGGNRGFKQPLGSDGLSTQTPVSGDGSAAAPWTVVTELLPVRSDPLQSYPDIKIKVIDSYVKSQLWLTRRIEVSGLPASGEKFKLYQFIDTFLDDRNPTTSNDDQGPGFIRTTPNNTTNVPDYVGVVKGAQMETLVHDFSAQTPIWDRYFTGQFNTPLSEMGNGTGDLSNTVDPNPNVDNGLGVQWNVPSGAPSFVVQYRVAFTYSPVDLFKRFTPATVKTAEASRLTFSLANRQTTDVVGLGFTDNLPAGVTVAPNPNIQTSCPAGSAMSANLPAGMAVEATAGSASIKVSNATLQKVAIAGDELHCEIAVDVVATQPGRYHNKTDNITGLVNIANMVIDEVLEVVKRDIAAADDMGATNPNADQIAVADVLANDSFDGQSAVAARGLLTLSTLSSSHPNISLDSSSGAVTVKKGTPAGDHSLKYLVCETALPNNCSTATASIKVTASSIVAQPDGGTADITSADQIAVPDVLANDSFNGQPAAGSRGLLSLTTLSASHANVSLNPITGAVNVKKGTPPGAQKLEYQICEIALPDNCSTATVALTVTLTTGKLVAQPDSASVDVTNGDKVAVADVLANDSFNDQAASAARAQLVLSTVSASHANVTLDASSGAVSVKKGTPAGNQTLNYKVCEKALPDNCSTATATITVSSGNLAAQPDSASVDVTNGDKVAVADVLANDSFNGQAASLARDQLVLTTESTTRAAEATAQATTKAYSITLDSATGAVTVKQGTPEGPHSLVYKVCEKAQPTNCSTAAVSLTVTKAGGSGTSGNITPVPVDHPLALLGLSGALGLLMLRASRRKQSPD